MAQSISFNGAVVGHNVIAGSSFGPGATMNNYFGPVTQVYPNTPAGPREPFSTVPFAPDPDFVDRPQILEWLRDRCAGPSARAALVGLGGAGKSQLAIQYAHSVRDAAPQTFVFWVHASTRARFEQGYRRIADRLELPGRLDLKADILRLVSNWLSDEANGQWVVVLDNVDDVETFFPLQQQGQESDLPSLAAHLPQSRNGSVLITSRSKEAAARLVGGYQNILEVPAMGESQGLQLLRTKLSPNKLQAISQNEGAATDLLRTLDHMPLAITQAAAYINRQARMSVTDYLSEFLASDTKRESLLHYDAGDLRRDESASNSVVTTWQMSFERIQQERPSAAELLSLMSFFNPQGIPERILQRHGSITASVKASDHASKANSSFSEDVNILYAYSLIAITTDDETYEMHPLVQFCTRVWLSSFSDVVQWKGKFIELMAQEFPSGEFENWPTCKQLFPHIETLYGAEPSVDETAAKWAQLLTDAAWYQWMKGDYQTAQAAARKAVKARERLLGLDNKQTLTSVTILAMVLQAQGKYSEAEKFNRRALEGYEKELGVRHPLTLTSVGNLASTLSYQGKYDEAEKLHRQALEGSGKELGVQHPSTLMSMNNLGSVLWHQRKYDEAEKLHRQALEGYIKEFGVQHSSTLLNISNLAIVLRYQGKYDEAEKLHRQALEWREKELGVHHPLTLTSVNTLALVLQDQGKYDEAERLNQRALEGYEKELGVQHPYTLTSLNHLALVLENQGKYGEAEKLNRRALEGSEKELGEQHPFTLTRMSDLASMLWHQEKYDEAEKLSRRALEWREKELGVHHPLTLTSVNTLALVLKDQGKYDEAERLNQRALEGYEKELGVQHPYTLTSVSNLANVLCCQGKYNEAEKLNWRVVEGREKKLGAHHPDTLISMNNLAGVLRYLGKYVEAEKLNQRVLEWREKELKVQHPDTLASMNNLAGVLQGQGKHDEAEKLYRRALEGCEKELGVQHPDTLTSAYCLACLLHMSERYNEAAELYQRAYEGRIQRLGPHHPDTIACGKQFSAFQQEQKNRGEDAVTVIGSKGKVKQGSLIARMRGKIIRREV